MDDADVFSKLLDLDTSSLSRPHWVQQIMPEVGAGRLPKAQLETLFLKLGFEFLAEREYSQSLEEENAHLAAIAGQQIDLN
jgi:hypothetical protein